MKVLSPAQYTLEQLVCVKLLRVSCSPLRGKPFGKISTNLLLFLQELLCAVAHGCLPELVISVW